LNIGCTAEMLCELHKLKLSLNKYFDKNYEHHNLLDISLISEAFHWLNFGSENLFADWEY